MKSLREFLDKGTEEAEIDTNGDGWLSPQELHDHLDVNRDGQVCIHDYAAHIMFHGHHPELLAQYTLTMDTVQRRHSMGENVNPDDKVLAALRSDATLRSKDDDEMNEAFVSRGKKEQDPPPVLLMRRKSIRSFPNGQKVALYYVDKLNKYVTVPYVDMNVALTAEESIPTVYDKVKQISESKHKDIVEHLDGSKSQITPEMAKQVMSFHSKLSQENKQQLKDMLEQSTEYFNKILSISRKG